jgi:SAM-dependent methyltransferase
MTTPDPIAEFYTSHPFPPPLDNLDRALDMYKDQNVLRSEFHLLWPNREYREDFDVLVAGCGTWQSAKYALTHPGARVVAIDVSTTSLEHTERLKQKYNLTNLDVRQLSIERAADLDDSFDHVICTGVLHHLVDPEAGLRALRSVLNRDGALYLMVYAPYGRAGIYMMQEYCRRLGVGTSEKEIDDLISVLRMLPEHHPVLSIQHGSREFNAEALADALLNPRERAYSVPEVFQLLDSSELMLGRWYWQAAYLPQCGAIATTPLANRLAEMPERERYAAMELWRGLMSNHSLIAYRNDGSPSNISFDEDGYSHYIPIRLPWTLNVQQSLPPGAAGALVNQTHVFDDLFVLISDNEKRMFDRIDGRRNIAQIIESADENDPNVAREFFEKLWRYDQIVFNTSQVR